MSRGLRRCTLGAVLALALAAAPAGAQAPAGDSVTGEARFCGMLVPCTGFPSTNLSVDVRSGPSGENPTGTVELTSGLGQGRFFIDAQATCLSVTGSVAVIGFTGTISAFRVELFAAGLLRVTDGGGPDSGLDTFEQARPDFASTPLPGPTDCSSFPDPDPPDSFPPPVNDVGDLVVTDAQPFPTSKEQCKKGGWRSFAFKNQGQCIASVQRSRTP